MSPAAERRDARDLEAWSSQSVDASAQRVEKAPQIDDLRLGRGAVEDRGSGGQHGGAHDVGGARDGRPARAAEIDAGALQSPRLGHDAAALDAQVGAQRRQAGQVQIDRPLADVATAG
jgi:hypothetical protein